MKNKYFVLFLINFIITFLYSQYLQNYCSIWYFGKKAGLNFNSNPPVALSDGQMEAIEGCSVLSRMNVVYFYTNGLNIWDRNHQIMPNGSGLLGHPSSTQSGLSVPVPFHSNLFYVFTTDANENYLQNGFRYSIIDMSLNNGYGDVTNFKNVLVHPSVTEKITVIPHANETDYWIIVHEWGTNRFLSYLLTENGLDTVPIISVCGSVHVNYGTSYCGNAVGYMKGSPDGNKIALVLHNNRTIELFDFNRQTGVLSNPIISSALPGEPYGVEFSPDSKKLYISTIYSNSKIYQYNLELANPFNSPFILAQSWDKEYSTLMLGPDGKIYVSLYSQGNLISYLGVINLPNNSGYSCDFVENGINLGTGRCYRGLPNVYYYNPLTNVKENDDYINAFYNSSFLYVSSKSLIENIKIIDSSGKIILNEDVKDYKYYSTFIFNLSKGIYILQVTSKEKIENKKLIIR